MPLYEYRCDTCHHTFEIIQKFSDPPAGTCPSCGGQSVQKLLSSPAIQFKGSGWYITDYARKGGGAESGKGGAEKGDKPTADAKRDNKASESKGTSESTSGKGESTAKPGAAKNE
jgi:putative FmdB family regulatory protein